MPAPGDGNVVDLATELRKGSASRFTVVQFADTTPANFVKMIPTPFSDAVGQYAGKYLVISGCDGVWEAGEQIVGGTSGAKARLMDEGILATTATATLSNISGTFQSGETVSSAYGASYATTTSAVYSGDQLDLTISPAGDVFADIEGDTSGATATVSSRVLADGRVRYRGDAAFTDTETITGQTSGTTATVVSSGSTTVTKTGSLCAGEPERWDYSTGGRGAYAASTPYDPDTSDMYGTAVRNTTATCVAGIDTGIDPTTDWFRVTCTYHTVTWCDYWTQSGPFFGLDVTEPHGTLSTIKTGWGHLRDQSVEPSGAHYMISVWNIPIIYNMDADEYHNTDNGPLTDTPGTNGTWDVVIEGNEDGTFDVSWDGTVLWGTGGVRGSAVSLPSQYTTSHTPTGVIGGMIVEIQNGASPGYRGYQTNPTKAGWLTTGGSGAPLMADFEYPGMTIDITIEW